MNQMTQNVFKRIFYDYKINNGAQTPL